MMEKSGRAYTINASYGKLEQLAARVRSCVCALEQTASVASASLGELLSSLNPAMNAAPIAESGLFVPWGMLGVTSSVENYPLEGKAQSVMRVTLHGIICTISTLFWLGRRHAADILHPVQLSWHHRWF